MNIRTEKTLSKIAVILSCVVLVIDTLFVLLQEAILPAMIGKTYNGFVYPFDTFLSAIVHLLLILICAVLIHKSSIHIAKIVCLVSLIVWSVFNVLLSIVNMYFTPINATVQSSDKLLALTSIKSILSFITSPFATCSYVILAILVGMLFAKDSIAKSAVRSTDNKEI